MIQPTYITNSNKRCLYCKGREVITITGDKLESSLEKVELEGKSVWKCKNKVECRQNIEAESTTIKFDEDIKHITITKHGETILEVKK